MTARKFYHGSPNHKLTELRPGSWITPDRAVAELMGRFHESTGKTWTDDDLAGPHHFGSAAKWKAGREPGGQPTVYELEAADNDIDLLDNPYEHKTLRALPVIRSELAGTAKEAAIQAAQTVCGVKTAGRLGGMIGNLGQRWKAPAPAVTPPALPPPPKPVPAPQPLQQPSTVGKMLGYKPTTTFGAKQANINSMADLAAENPERQIGSNVKQAELVPEVQLQEHQQRIADRVTEDNPRLLVYHGLGSGKSLSALAAAEAAQKLYGGNYGVVVPASLRGNFQKEIKKFTRGSDPEVMSYTGLGMGKQFKDAPETLIMDEAARLRNPNSAMTQAAMRQARDAERLLLLTGTPITNAPTDLAPLVAMLDGKNIDPKAFGERYVGYKKVSPGFFGWLRGVKPGVRPYIKNEKELRQLLAGKVDYQPSKTPEGVNINEEIVRVPLSKEQQKIQRAIRTKIPPGFLWKLDREFPLSKDELSRLNGFLTGLRQVGLSTQPFRADKDPLKAFDQSAKLQKAFENLKSTLDSDPRKKALIYSNFVDAGLGPYAAGLQRANIPHAFFHGGVSPKARQAAVDAYNAGKLRALLIGPAGAEGISTKGTSLIQLMDPHWNEARTQQAQGRGLRFDSHRDLPEELKNVAVQRYLNQSEEPGWFSRKFMGKKRERTADEVLERLTAEKEQLNEAFRNLLREIGSQK